jgi:nucleoside-diphosphate-sugar epimerase
MKVLITGICGFIGRWLSERLVSEHYDVVGVDPAAVTLPGATVHAVNILDRAALVACFAQEAPDLVVHLAATTDLDGKDLSHYAANIAGVENLLEAVRATPSVKRVLVTSTQLVCKVGYVPKTDTDYLPSTLYGESKIRTEEITRACDGGGAEWCLIRPTTVWGPGMNEHYRTFLRFIEKGLYFHSGSSKLYKTYGYVGNVAYEYARLLQADAGDIHRRVFYVADYAPLSLREYGDALADGLGVRRPVVVPIPAAKLLAYLGDGLSVVGVKFPFTSFRLRNILTEYQFDMSGTRRICGPLPYSFQEGVNATVAAYKARRNKSPDGDAHQDTK